MTLRRVDFALLDLHPASHKSGHTGRPKERRERPLWSIIKRNCNVSLPIEGASLVPMSGSSQLENEKSPLKVCYLAGNSNSTV